MKMRKTVSAVILILCLGLTACGGSAPAQEASADTQSQSAEEADKEVGQEAGQEAGQETEEGTAEDNSDAAVTQEEIKEPTIVEITNENWEQYFEVLPVHASYPYILEGSEDEQIVSYNGFVLVLKDEYLQNYLDNSGYFISDDMLRDYNVVYNEEEYNHYKDKGEVNIPEGADVTATVLFQYDGELLGADDNEHPSSDISYPVGFNSGDVPIEFERKALIDRTRYALYVHDQALKNSTVEVLPGMEESDLDYTTSEVQTVERVPRTIEMLYALMEDKVFSPLVSVACVRSGEYLEDRTWEETGEILDHFTVSVEDISGTVAIWE